MQVMNKKYILSMVFVVVASTASIMRVSAQTSLFGSILSDGLIRDYKIYIPAIYNGSAPVPLVFNLHGYGSNLFDQEQYGDFRAIADTANFILVHPNGTIDSFNSLSWNTFGNSTTNDVGFFSNLIDTLRLTYNIDTTAIYSTGMSNGGFMSYELACQLSNRIAAVASVTGSITTSFLAACNPQRPVAVMQIHGTTDGTVPYIGNFLFQPIESVINYWVQFNNCDSIPTFNAVPDVVTTDFCTAEHYVYANGNNDVEVEFYKILGGGHSWPGAPINLNTTNMDFSASQQIWRFFRKHKLSGNVVPSKENTIAKKHDFEIFPNPNNGVFALNLGSEKQRKIELNNALGQLINTFYSNTSLFQLSLEIQGVYFITVSDESGNSQTKKVIKF
jgi:polyhydroxybutyrate depolymerase